MFTISNSHRMLARRHGALIARILIGALFVVAGWGKISGFDGVAGYIESAGLPAGELLATLAIIIEIGAGLMLITGWRIEVAALSLIIFTVIASFAFHGPHLWAESAMQQTNFLKNLAVVGGLIYVFAYGAGDGWSLWKKPSTV